VILDSETFSYTQYPSSSNELWSQAGLASGQHRVEVIPHSVLDSAVIEMDVDAQMMLAIDDSQLFNTPPLQTSISVHGDWISNQCFGAAHAGTCHASQAAGDSFSYTFQGDAISVWGALEDVQAGYTVSIDGSSPASYTGNAASASSSPVILATASNLGPGNHVITITNAPADGSSRLQIDYVTLFTDLSSSSSSPQISKSTKIGLIVGGVLGCFLFASGLMAYLLLREKQDTSKAAAAKARDSGAWSFKWPKEKGSFSDDDASSTRSGSELPFPVLARSSNTKTTSFDQPWLESSPPSFDSPASPRSDFLAKWRY